MRSTLVFVTLFTLLGAACTKGPTAPTETATGSTTTRLSFTSTPASFVGPARTYTLQNATFRALSLRSGGALEIDARPSNATSPLDYWTFTMGSPFGRGLAPGTYTTNRLGTDGDYSSLFFGGDRYCGSAGSVTIHEIAITPSVVQRFRASFTIQCDEGATLRGDIVVLADPWR